MWIKPATKRCVTIPVASRASGEAGVLRLGGGLLLFLSAESQVARLAVVHAHRKQTRFRERTCMDGWHFTRTPSGWEWHYLECTGKVGKKSRCAFGSMLECIADAKANGYWLMVAAAASMPSHRREQAPVKQGGIGAEPL